MPFRASTPPLPSDDKRWRIVNGTMRRHGYSTHALIETLHTVQQSFGYVDTESMRYVAASLRVPLSRAYGVATFYHFFNLKPPGKHTCLVCMGTACYIKGGAQLMARAEKTLGVKPGESTSDGAASLLSVRCVGACSSAPVVVLDEESLVTQPNSSCRNGWKAGSPMTFEELEQIAATSDQAKRQAKHHVDVCVAAGCLSLHSDAIKDAIEKQCAGAGVSCQVRGTGCMGLCSAGPLVAVESNSVLYRNATLEEVPAIVQSLEGQPLERLQVPREQPFFVRQVGVVLENSGKIDPEKVEDYIGADGYKALIRAVTEMRPSGIIQIISRSGLRGRGGGGYPTGLKWGTVAKAAGTTKYVICNADEGDPGAFMDRSVLESDPHRVLEGMIIAGYAVGASRGYIYVRAEYPLAVKRLTTAIRESRRLGFLGNGICSSAFNFDIEIRLGAGAFVCGEETALIASIEGRRGTPRPRPPYPAQSGLYDMPTLINNVETFANVAPIIRHGDDWYSARGTSKSKGTKVFALTGKIRNSGLIEVPMGITLREIIFDIGGGVPDGHQFKAVQTGGPSGGCIPEPLLDTRVDYESLSQVGSIMGSGGMIVMDDSACMVNVARFFMEFCMTESCGKCIPCRVGTVQMFNLLTLISQGNATLKDLDMLTDLCDMVSATSLCGLGQTAPNPVLSTLRYFKSEYMDHIESKWCPAGVCECSNSPSEVAM